MRAVDKCYLGAAAMFEAGNHPEITPAVAIAMRAIHPIMESLSDSDRAMLLLVEVLRLGVALAEKEQSPRKRGRK